MLARYATPVTKFESDATNVYKSISKLQKLGKICTNMPSYRLPVRIGDFAFALSNTHRMAANANLGPHDRSREAGILLLSNGKGGGHSWGAWPQLYAAYITRLQKTTISPSQANPTCFLYPCHIVLLHCHMYVRTRSTV